MEHSLKIFELLGVTDFEELDQTQLLILYMLSQEVEKFGMYRCRDANVEGEGKLMQQKISWHLRVLLARTGGVTK